MSDRPVGARRLDFGVPVADDLPEDLIGVLARERRGFHVRRRIRQLDRVADGQEGDGVAYLMTDHVVPSRPFLKD